MGERPAPQPGKDLLFTDEDVIEILDRIADERLLCPGCGEPRAESFAVENEYAYEAVALECHACAPKQRVGRSHAGMDGLYTFVTKRLSRT